MRRVHYNLYYGLGNITISGDNSIARGVLVKLILIEINLPIIEFNEVEESANLAY